MNRPYYKPISWEEATTILGKKNGKAKSTLLVTANDGGLKNPFEMKQDISALPNFHWYLKYEQQEQPSNNVEGYLSIDSAVAYSLHIEYRVNIFTRLKDGSMKRITEHFRCLDGLTLYIRGVLPPHDDVSIRPEVSD